jgi:Domain of unknown function (DUF4120)
MSLKIDCQKHFAEVTQFALQNGCLLKLAERLDYLAKYGDGSNICHLYYDYAPNSFAFVMTHSDGTRWFNGGLIYSGPGRPRDGSGPALTEGIGIDTSRHGWSVHK